jgi:hypothetical protein
VVVFTECVDTQTLLAGLTRCPGYSGGEPLGLLGGGIDTGRHKHLTAALQAPPERSPVRVPLATDAASEGIDLQDLCCGATNFDIAFNLDRLELPPACRSGT